MQSKWTHSVCSQCYDVLDPYNFPTRMIEPPAESCCVCGVEHKSGIYFRLNPELRMLKCKGEHRVVTVTETTKELTRGE